MTTEQVGLAAAGAVALVALAVALRAHLRARRAESLAVVADAIRAKAGLAHDGDDAGFLADYYAALCVRLERGMLMGRRRLDKYQPARAR